MPGGTGYLGGRCSAPARSHPRRRLRRCRRGTEARAGGRRRRRRRRERLPQLPADAVPAGDRADRHDGGRTLAARPLRAPAERNGHQARVSAVDLDAREVQFADMAPLHYDYLVIGLGAVVQFFGCKGAPEYAFPLYTVEDALRLRSQVVARWEAADRGCALAEDGALNVVVVGGGPTRIESVGALSELYRSDFRNDYGEALATQARLTSSRPAPSFSRCSSRTSVSTHSTNSRSAASRSMLGERVESVDRTRVTLASGTVLRPTRSSGAPGPGEPTHEVPGNPRSSGGTASRSIRRCG